MRIKPTSFLLVILILTLGLTACGGGGTGGSDVDPKAGEELFAQTIIGSQAGCSTCHSLQTDVIIVGPSLGGIATRASTRVSGMSAEEYIRESILKPDAYLVEGFPSGTMPQVWGEELGEEQLNNLVAYLLTLK